jgi:hypothetical protein
MQIMGKPFSEETLLRIAFAYEQATDRHKRKPSLSRKWQRRQPEPRLAQPERRFSDYLVKERISSRLQRIQNQTPVLQQNASGLKICIIVDAISQSIRRARYGVSCKRTLNGSFRLLRSLYLDGKVGVALRHQSTEHRCQTQLMVVNFDIWILALGILVGKIASSI